MDPTTSTLSPPPIARSPSLTKLTPPKDLPKSTKLVVFEYFFRQLASFRNTALLYADAEDAYQALDESTTIADEFKELSNGMSNGSRSGSKSPEGVQRKEVPREDNEDTLTMGSHRVPDKRWRMQYNAALNVWAQGLARNAWVACSEEDEGKCPKLDLYTDTSTKHLVSQLPSLKDTSQLINTILFLHITSSKQYSALTRSFLASLGDQLTGRDVRHHILTDDKESREKEQEVPEFYLDEESIAWTLKNPGTAISQAQAQAESIASQQAQRSSLLRNIGVGFGAVAGGILVGVTGGLAAPLVGAGITAVLGIFGVGGTIVGLIASGLTGSAVVCGALFGVYGAKSTAEMVERHTREVRDLAILPVSVRSGSRRGTPSGSQTGSPGGSPISSGRATPDAVRNTLGVRLCEIEALEALSNALSALLKAEALKYVKGEVVKRTVLAGLMAALAPLGLLRIGKIMDNPWMNARALGIKTGAVLAQLLADKAFGNRPVTLVGYSLGSLVIYQALLELAALPPSETMHLVQDVYLFGSPVPADPSHWAKIRRIVSGRVVNGYSNRDYVLAVLSRAADATWNVAGLEPVGVKGVENILCDEVDGHTLWRGLVGKYLSRVRAPGLRVGEVHKQETEVVDEINASSFLGGLTIPLPVHALTLLNGNVFGISGFLHRAVKGNVEGAAGVAGLVLGGMLVAAIDGGVAPASLPLPIFHVACSGFLVGLGTKLSNGCTSGHMICGLSRFSQRSLVATASFFTTGAITASLVHKDLPAIGSVDWSLGASGAKYLAVQLFPFAASLALYALAPRTPESPSLNSPSNTDPNEQSTLLSSDPSSADKSSASASTTLNAASSQYYQPAKVLRTLGFITTAVQFALALQLSNLTDPLRVVSFLLLPWHRAFDPSLAALAAGALPLATGLWRYARGSEVPVCGGKWNIPKGGCVDWKLVTGAALFGVGWGLAGVCPGPGLVNLGRAVVAGGNITPFATYLIALVAGGLLV